MKISVVTATYNASVTISECLDSVSAQSAETEQILIDGASTDTTMEIVKRHRPVLSTVVSEPDEGIYHAMNKGLRLATGEVVGILNADDCYASENTLAAVLQAFSDPSIDVCYGDLVYVDADETDRVVRYWRSGEYKKDSFLWGWMPPHPTFFVRRSVYQEHGVFNLDLGSAADYELMLRFMLRHRLKAAYIPEVLVRMRTGGVSNVSLRNRLAANRMDRKAWELNGLKPYPWTLWAKPIRKLGQWFVRGEHPG